MNNSKKSFSSALKGLTLGLMVGSIATMVFSSTKPAKKIKKATENTIEGISSMFQMN